MNNKFDHIIQNIDNKINNNQFKNYIKNILTNWFISLNLNDLNILTIFSTFLALRIKNLFINNDFEKQYKNNSDQDTKAIILLLLPYINDDKVNVYKELKDLNELVLSKEISPDIFDTERFDILKKNFRYTNIGIGLFDINNQINLNDRKFGKLIYKIIYHNFISLNETLSIINGKLYVNWLNIVPLNLNNYKESFIYKNTEANLDSAIINLQNNNFIELIDYNGLYIGEFYNVYRNIYYENIKKVKWFIFINNNEYIIQYLANKFNFDNFFEFNSFDDLDSIEKANFKRNLTNIKENEYYIWKNIILFFVNNYTYKTKINDYKTPFLFNIENDGTEDNDFTNKTQNNINNITNIDIKNFIDNIEENYLWDYIKESLIIFESNMYSKYLIKNNKVINITYFENSKLNYKNLYNIAKSLSHDTEWNLLPTKYSSLSIDQQKEFWNKFNLVTANWLNLRSNIYLEGTAQNYNTRLQEILYSFNQIKEKLVWEYLVYNGLLTDFKINLLTSKTEITKYIKKELDNDKYKDSYYYLTNKQYKEQKYRYEKKDSTYFKCLENQLWYSFYAMNWVSQIGFFHHYLNHRVLYITGATGQGKSTQVPKLFMYALKMLDYKNNGKVMCTQPRIGPTNAVSSRISDELGVPIYQYSNTLKDKIKSNNYYVQYTYSTDKHTITNANHLSLTLLTDGTLLSTMTENPILKEKNINKIYSANNIFDIIIVDEAHEHNTNMDIILTLARQSCYMNNSVKFIIMSATMDDDEPHFRRYYHNINDNLVYPLRTPIIDYFDNNLFLYDSIYLDRRFHIAPPGQSTQYDIKEIYVDKAETNSIVTKILESSTYGDILIFENGIADINKRVKSLNDNTPNNTITIPYISTLAQKYKDIIESNSFDKIRTDKKIVDKIWGEKYIESNSVSEGTYTRRVIVATNVAEASLTINSLRYVIDNGFAKVNSYNDITDITKQEVEMISEASRKQRKGRVGRVASGTVYYLYEQGAREKIKPKYKITQDDFGESLLALLETKTLNNEPLIYEEYNPNKSINYLNDEINDDFKQTEFYKKNIYNIFKEQYKTIYDYQIYWNSGESTEQNEVDVLDLRSANRGRSIYFNDNNLLYMNRIESGYNLETLLDLDGLFYIIHPFENKIKRNILGNIIQFCNFENKLEKKNKLPEYFFTNLLNNQMYKNFLVNINGTNDLHSLALRRSGVSTSLRSIDSTELNYEYIYKTEIIDYVSKTRKLINLNEISNKDLIILLSSKAYNSFYEVLEILTMIKTINNNIKNLIVDISIYNEQDNELIFIYNLIQSFKKSFHYLSIFEIKNNKTTYSKIINEKIDKYLFDRKIYNYDPPKTYSVYEWNKLNYLYKNGKIRNGFNDLIGEYLIQNDNIDVYKNDIIKWCSYNNINSEIFINYLIKHKKILLEFLTISKNLDKNNNEVDPLTLMEQESTSFKKSLLCKNEFEHIIRPFIHGYPLNIALKIDSKDNFYKILLSNLKIKNSNKNNNNNLIFYYFSGESLLDNNLEMSLTNKIDIEWLFNVLPIYYKPSNFKNIMIKKTNNNINKIEKYGDIYNDFCVELKNKYYINNLPYESSENMTILKIFINNIKKF